MSASLHQLLEQYREAAKSEREKGTYFEELIRTYLRHEPTYSSLFEDVWLLSEVPEKYDIDKNDTGIDLVARTKDTGEFHAIQCKFYADDYVIQKRNIDSFFTASGQKPFVHRWIVTTTNHWGKNAEAALFNQNPPVNTIDLHDLEHSQIDWSQYKPSKKPVLKPKFEPRQHQLTAINKVAMGLENADRGKLIMACGTGKTFTALKIAENQAGKDKRVLFLVPSLALLSQTLTEWTQQSTIPLNCFAVCSDAQVGKKRTKANEDVVETFAHELRYPATTDESKLAEEIAKRHDKSKMSVVFSTYHSIDVISKAQNSHGMGVFDLIICDEAHRTTGATFESDEESAFVRVHDNKHIEASKRLYMTATPRIYGDIAKAKALQEGVAICSMDDEGLYGKELHIICFSEAVELGLLTDYKVVVLAIDEDHVSSRLQNLLKDDNNQLRVDDAAKIIGCWKALCKQGINSTDKTDDLDPMQRAVAFCQVIEPSTGSTHKVSSKQISSMFQSVIEAYQETTDDSEVNLTCDAEHVDGSMNATQKEAKINWLKEPVPKDTCRILSNVRCLSEGVDVPALDAVLFMSPRNSQVDVVQSVGRVMRKAEGKKLGYVVLPVVIPHGMTAKDALDDNKVYRVVWEVLQALRSHDDRFDAFVNKVDLMSDTSGRMEVVAITDTLSPSSRSKSKKQPGKGTHNLADEKAEYKPEQREMHYEVGELERALQARLVKKCGNRMYWEEWANDIAKIAQTHISRIAAIVKDESNNREIEAFRKFTDELQDDLNDSITEDEVIEMLAQHLITKPVFEALFSDYSFGKNNPVSQGMQSILDLLQEHRLNKEVGTLEQFYATVRRRADGIDNAEGKQKIVLELYDKFFRNAFPKMTERLGIVYTPVEVVDFIIHSVNNALQDNFDQSLGSDGVHILDPFVGTGTFITRLMQSGLITTDQLTKKYKSEIHCNEVVLLAYYIAAINIEAVYHSLVGEKPFKVAGEGQAYLPFEGICLADTFQMYESEDAIEQYFPNNSERRKRQKNLDIRVIIGNPPYSAKQGSANDNNQNVSYTKLDDRIRSTYAINSSATNKSGLYDSYVRAIRWASDRVGDSGIIAFVTNASFLEASVTDGLRKCLADEFSHIYVFHLRGNQRTAGELSKKEGGKIFGSGSRAPIAVTLLVKNGSNSTVQPANIQWHDIGDYLTTEEKLKIISKFGSIQGITESDGWESIVPDEYYDWRHQRNNNFQQHISLGDKKNVSTESIYDTYSTGLQSNRDAWVYNCSNEVLISKIKLTISIYNSELKRFTKAANSTSKQLAINDFVTHDSTKISWSSSLKSKFTRGVTAKFNTSSCTIALYRPFSKCYVYFDSMFNHRVSRIPTIFPSANSTNKAIYLSGVGGSGKDFSVIMTDVIPDLNLQHSGGQCFPLYIYDANVNDGQIDSIEGEKRYAISKPGLNHFHRKYGKDSIELLTEEDLFYYIYGLLHSTEYRNQFKENLSKELPRIPVVKSFADFQAFSQAGRDLAHWHLDYETVDRHPVNFDFTGGPKSLAGCKDEHFYVKKMKFPKIKDTTTNKRINDKSTIIYNDYITVNNIPLEAYEYVVNGKSAIDWVMERQAVTTHTKSGIVNDANHWAVERMSNSAYPLELLQRVITVSLETKKIIDKLPKLDFN